MSSILGDSGSQVSMMGYPEQGGVTDFSQNQNLGSIQSPGSGFLGGLSGNQMGNQGMGQDVGGLLGSLLGQGMNQSPLGALLHYGLQSYLQTGQFPTLQSTIKNLVGPMGQVPKGGQAGGISSILGGYTGGIIGGHGGA